MTAGLDWERELVGMALWRPTVTDRLTVTVDDFADPYLGALWHTIRAVTSGADTAEVGMVHVHGCLTRWGWRVPLPDRVVPVDPDLLLDVYREATVTGSPEFVAEQVTKASLVRQLLTAGRQLDQAGENTDTDTVLDMAARTGVRLMEIADTGTDGPARGLLDVDAVPSRREPEWLIPRLFSRTDRLVVVGDEGAGKMVFLRLLAACAAAGVHPFRGETFTPLKALIVDLENPRAVAEDNLAWILDLLQARTPVPIDRARLRRQYLPDGLNLRDPHDARHLEASLRVVEPDVVVLGPIYKAYRVGRDDAETAAVDCQRVLDRLRVRWGCALLMEAHAPLEQQGKRYRRPFGSGAWSRWPEFGLSLVPSVEVDQKAKREMAEMVADRPDLLYVHQHLGRFRQDRYRVEWPVRVSRHPSLVLEGHWS